MFTITILITCWRSFLSIWCSISRWDLRTLFKKISILMFLSLVSVSNCWRTFDENVKRSENKLENERKEIMSDLSKIRDVRIIVIWLILLSKWCSYYTEILTLRPENNLNVKISFSIELNLSNHANYLSDNITKSANTFSQAFNLNDWIIKWCHCTL